MTHIVFWEYDLLPPLDGPSLICIGERVKKGTYRPCIETVPFSTISGALRQYYSRTDITAVGFFVGELEKIRVENSAHNRATEAADLPLTTEVLVNPRGKVYVLIKKDDFHLENVLDSQKDIPLCLGALKSKGFGRCRLQKVSEKVITDPESEKRVGELKTRIPEGKSELFGIGTKDILKPVYGYMFQSTSLTDGVYVRSLFEGSIVRGYEFLVKGIM